MARNGRQHDGHARERIAAAAARLIAEEGVTGFRAAREKAMRRLGLTRVRDLPTALEIERALADYQRLFQGSDHDRRLQALRRHAVQAMRRLAPVRPRLVGRVLSGTAAEHTPVTLHLFTDSPEEVSVYLMDRTIPYRMRDKRLRDGEGRWRTWPGFSFLAGDTEIELVVFGHTEFRHAPPSPVDGRPMPRAALAQVEELLDDDRRRPAG